MPTRNSPRRPEVAGIAAALLLLGTALPTYAFDPAVEDEVRFQINCAILLFTDPDEHADLCDPVFPLAPPESLIELEIGAAPPPPPPPPPTPPPPPAPVEEEEVDEEEEPCVCGPCHYPK